MLLPTKAMRENLLYRTTANLTWRLNIQGCTGRPVRLGYSAGFLWMHSGPPVQRSTPYFEPLAGTYKCSKYSRTMVWLPAPLPLSRGTVSKTAQTAGSLAAMRQMKENRPSASFSPWARLGCDLRSPDMHGSPSSLRTPGFGPAPARGVPIPPRPLLHSVYIKQLCFRSCRTASASAREQHSSPATAPHSRCCRGGGIAQLQLGQGCGLACAARPNPMAELRAAPRALPQHCRASAQLSADRLRRPVSSNRPQLSSSPPQRSRPAVQPCLRRFWGAVCLGRARGGPPVGRGRYGHRRARPCAARAEVQNRELLVGDVLALMCFCIYKQVGLRLRSAP